MRQGSTQIETKAHGEHSRDHCRALEASPHQGCERSRPHRHSLPNDDPLTAKRHFSRVILSREPKSGRWRSLLERLVLETYTAFADQQRIATGELADIAPAVKAAYDAGTPRLLVFDDSTGRIVELDLRGSLEQVLERLQQSRQADSALAKPVRGRPKLGVTAREVTLLPSHWEWLAAQPGGASAALRRLVEKARRSGSDKVRQAEEAARRVMLALAGDLPDFEEATRAFYAKDYARFDQLSREWPKDIGDYVRSHVRGVVSAASE